MDSTSSTVLILGTGAGAFIGVFLLLGFSNTTVEPQILQSHRLRLGLGLGL